jgi:hypothetical protein
MAVCLRFVVEVMAPYTCGQWGGIDSESRIPIIPLIGMRP